jgi:hypothetical protein
MTSTLSAAASFLRQTARSLELRAYECLFEGAPHDGFVAALAAFRREDGGFGGALEPDARTPDSQPLFVDFALKSLYQVGARATELGAGTCAFLRSVSEPSGALPHLLPGALEHPRANHWQTLQPPCLELTFGIAALLHWLEVEDAWLDAATESCWSALGDPPDEAHPLIGVLHFLEHAPPRPERDARLAHVRERLPNARWLSVEVPFEGYALTPLDLAPHPDAPARACFDDATIEAHLDALVARQQEDGGWPLSWEPPGEVARAEWRGKWTLDALVVLDAYGRL